MIAARAVLAACISLALAGCFTSEEPLIDEESAAAPNETITFRADSDDETATGVRDGSEYVVQSPDGHELRLRFREIAEETFVVELTDEQDGEVLRLYGVLAVDIAAGRAAAYKAFASPADLGPGLRECPGDTICIDDFDAYAALGLAEIAAGAEPSAVYEITVE